jgi:hypothetical protein
MAQNIGVLWVQTPRHVPPFHEPDGRERVYAEEEAAIRSHEASTLRQDSDRTLRVIYDIVTDDEVKTGPIHGKWLGRIRLHKVSAFLKACDEFVNLVAASVDRQALQWIDANGS